MFSHDSIYKPKIHPSF